MFCLALHSNVCDVVTSLTDFGQICRICLKQNVNMISIFESNILTAFSKFTDIQVQINDGLPTGICSNCLAAANECAKFKELCEMSDKHLRNILEASLIKAAEQRDNINETPVEDRNVVPSVGTTTCGKRPRKNVFYERSNYRHRQEIQNKCTKCPKQLYQSTVLHSNKVRSDDTNPAHTAPPPLECTECNKQCTSQEAYETHMKVAHRTKEYQYFCTYCSKGYVLERKLNEHVRTHESDSYRKYTCEHCNKCYQHNQSLKKHVERHHTHVQLKYNCELCGVRVFDLKEHYLCKHSKEKPFECKKCSRHFATETLLRCHIKIKHERRYAGKKVLCNVCGLQSFSAYHLRIHMRTHADDKPFKCAQCDKAFKSPVGLRAHRTAHTDVRPFTCAVCEKAFKQRKALNRHSIIHTTERPHACAVCGKRFNEKSILNRHMHVHSVHAPKSEQNS